MKENYVVIEKFISTGERIIDKQAVPLYPLEAFASIQQQFVDAQEPEDEVQIFGVPRCDGVMHITGNSMYPLIVKGDLVAYKTVMNRRGGLFFGHIYLLSYDIDGEEFITVKRVYESDVPGHYRLVSDNPEYKPVDIPTSCVRKMALIKATLRYNSIE